MQQNLEIAMSNLANVIVNGPHLLNGLLAVGLVALETKQDHEFNFKLHSMEG
jgi:hypothetical protein